MKLPRLRAPVLLSLLVVVGWPVAVAAAESPAGRNRLPGKFAWADLVTTDPEAVANFYTKTFGWTARKAGPGREAYTLLLNAGHPVGGIAFRAADAGSKAPHGARWIGSISVADIHQAVAAVVAAGGTTVVPPRQVAGLGWQAIVADREGSLFGLLVSDAGDTPKGPGRENDWTWVQLLARQPHAAAEFYEKALGYAVTGDARTPRTDDYLLTRDGVACAGLTALPAIPGARGGWLGYVRVAGVPAAVDTAKSLGAQVLFGPQDVPGGLQVAVITDPLGGAIGLVGRSSPTEAKK